MFLGSLGEAWPGIPNGQKHVCRDSDALWRWTVRFGHRNPEYVHPEHFPHTQEWLDRHGGL
jgi:hypothetical protein